MKVASETARAAGGVPRVTVIVVSWNALPLLRRFLPSVVRSTWPNLEIVLADNGSTDGSAEWVRAEVPSVRVIGHPENWGYCRGNNEAIRRTDGEYVVLLNNDVEVEPGWLEPLVAAVETDPTVGAVQPKILDHLHRDRFEYAGACGGHLDRLGYPFARGRIFFNLEVDRGQHDTISEVFWASGAAVLFRRIALDEAGLLDESFEFHMEEIDLCWRLRRHGWRILVEPRSRVYHVGGGSLAQGDPRKTYYNFRNSLLMLRGNLPARAWTSVFLQRLAVDAVGVIRFLARGEWASASAVLRAYLHAHRMRNTRARPREDGIRCSYRGCVAFDYFLLGRRTFGALRRDRFVF